MNLYLMRHAIAEDVESAGLARDAERALTREGKRKLRGIATAMLGMQLEIGLVLTSPYKRARQTAEGVLEVMGGAALQECPALAPDGTPVEVVRALRGCKPLPENLLLVGHEPNLSHLASWLMTGRVGVPLRLKKGGLCGLTCEDLMHGTRATLEWLLTPRQMLKMT